MNLLIIIYADGGGNSFPNAFRIAILTNVNIDNDVLSL